MRTIISIGIIVWLCINTNINEFDFCMTLLFMGLLVAIIQDIKEITKPNREKR